jgi:hypothetical protein
MLGILQVSLWIFGAGANIQDKRALLKAYKGEYKLPKEITRLPY